MQQSNAWCVSCQRWEGERTSTHYDRQPKLWYGTVGAGTKWHIGNKLAPLAFCTVGEFKALILACSEVIGSEKIPPICKNCLRRWQQAPVYRDF